MHSEQKSIKSCRGLSDSLHPETQTTLSMSSNREDRANTAELLLQELEVYQIEIERQNVELRRMQLLVEESHDQYKNFYDFCPIGYLSISRDGVIKEINITGTALLKEECCQLINRRFDLLVVAENQDLWQQHFITTKQSAEKQRCDLGLIRGDGSVFQARLECLRISSDNESAVRIIFSDFTEQNRLEREVQERTKEMTELHTQHVATQTAVSIAHDLNQPLLAIASYSEAALMLLKAEHPDLGKIQKAVSGCERQALRAGKSIRELLDFLGMREMPVEVFDLNKEVNDVLNFARMEFDLQFETILNLDRNLPFVRASRTHVNKALLNLLRNGIEAMQEAGISQPTITVTVGINSDEKAAQVTVHDNGPGVKEEVLHRLFKPFFTTKDKGIGMGLAVSRSLIEENGGHLWIDQKAKLGATFQLTLPFAS